MIFLTTQHQPSGVREYISIYAVSFQQLNNNNNNMSRLIKQQQQQQQEPSSDGSSNDFLRRASLAAQYQVKSWIRATLREVALQSLQQQHHLAKKAATTTTTTTTSTNQQQQQQQQPPNAWILTQDAITAAQASCEWIAQRWADKLLQGRHEQVAEWIQQVVETYGSTLYYDATTTTTTTTATTILRGTTSALTATAAAAAETCSGNDNKSQQQQQQDQQHVSSASQRPVELLTTVARLRTLGKSAGEKSTQQQQQQHEEAIMMMMMMEQLNAWARQGKTDWPYSWDIIEKFARDIPSRLHGRIAVRDDEQVTFIPRAVWEEQQQQQQQEQEQEHESATDANTTLKPNNTATTTSIEQHKQRAIQLLLERKRKSARRAERLRPAKRANIISSTSSQVVEQEKPRPASSVSDLPYLDFHKGWTNEERERMERYVHTDDNESSTPRSILLGPLHDLGRHHYFYQSPIDLPEGTLTLSSKKRRRFQRSFVSQRLGDHQQDSDISNGRRERKSRVTATEAPSTGEYFYDFDLGSCMLEYVETSPENVVSKRQLLAFSSVEAMLLNEDNAP